MYSTIVYQYIPRQIVVVNIGNSPRRYQNVYSKTLKLHKGVDNKLQFQFLNQEQKPVDITGQEITIRLISYDGMMILYQKTLNPTLALNGLAEFTISSSDLSIMDPQKCYYSLEFPSNGFDFPVYLDNDSSARGVVDIVDSILPDRSHAQLISIPDHAPITSYGVAYNSSVFQGNDNPILSMQFYYNNYSGTVTIQGSTTGTSSDSEWYDILNYSFTNETSTQGYLVEGYHPYLRVEMFSSSGSIDNILAK